MPQQPTANEPAKHLITAPARQQHGHMPSHQLSNRRQMYIARMCKWFVVQPCCTRNPSFQIRRGESQFMSLQMPSISHQPRERRLVVTILGEAHCEAVHTIACLLCE